MELPVKYQWINNIGTLPKLLSAGLQYLGVKEINGAKSNPIILDMAAGLGIGDIYRNDDTSWCAVFINHLIRITGKPLVNHKGDRFNLMRARWLENWGDPVPRGEEKLGDIGIFSRTGGGHVGIIIAENDHAFLVFGGNQNNQVSFTWIEKSRLVACRRYYKTGPPKSAAKFILNESGELSVNEK